MRGGKKKEKEKRRMKKGNCDGEAGEKWHGCVTHVAGDCEEEEKKKDGGGGDLADIKRR